MRQTRLLSVFWHGVAPDSSSPDDVDSLSSFESVFRAQIEFIISNYTPVSISRFLECVGSTELIRSYIKPPILLSFDDGLASVITTAVPILTELKIPAVFFVVGEILRDPEFVPWFLETRHLIRKTERSIVRYDGGRLDLSRRTNHARLRRLVGASFRRCTSEEERQMLMRDLADLLGVDRPSASDLDPDLRLVTRDILGAFSSSGLLTIASHAMTHRHLAALTYEEQRYELEQSDLLLRTHCSSYYPAIAYPDGSFNADTIAIGRRIYRAGFAALRSSSYRNLYAYPRVGLDRCSVSETAYAISPARLRFLLPLKRFLDTVGLQTV